MNKKKVIVTGASGKTGSRLAAQLETESHQVYRLSRSYQNVGRKCYFQWEEPTSHDLGISAEEWQEIDAAYLLAPSGVFDLMPVMKPFIDKLLKNDIIPVLLSASSLEKGGPFMGAVHEYLEQNASHWYVVRPSWFMQNFSEQQHLPTIRNEGKIYSATNDANVGFINADDIAAVVARLLTDPSIEKGDYIITGPEAISYDTVARIISETTGKPIRHEKLSETQLSEFHQKGGLPKKYADGLAAMDTLIATGSENRTTEWVEKLTDRTPISFAEFAHANRLAWQ